MKNKKIGALIIYPSIFFSINFVNIYSNEQTQSFFNGNYHRTSFL